MISNKNIVIDDLLLNYYSYLPKNSNKTVLILHGWGVDSRSWFHIADRLMAGKCAVYILDLPGFGQSQVPDSSFNVDSYKKIVLGFIRKLELDKVILIGHSFGGRISIKIGAEKNSSVNKIILVDTAGIAVASPFRKVMLFLAKIISPVFRPDFMQPLRKKLYFLFGSEYLDDFKLSSVFSNVVAENLTRLLFKIKIPVLIIWGKNDRITPLYYGRLTNKLIKNSRLVVFGKSGHFPYLTEREKFMSELNRFI